MMATPVAGWRGASSGKVSMLCNLVVLWCLKQCIDSRQLSGYLTRSCPHFLWQLLLLSSLLLSNL